MLSLCFIANHLVCFVLCFVHSNSSQYCSIFYCMSIFLFTLFDWFISATPLFVDSEPWVKSICALDHYPVNCFCQISFSTGFQPLSFRIPMSFLNDWLVIDPFQTSSPHFPCFYFHECNNRVWNFYTILEIWVSLMK